MRPFSDESFKNVPFEAQQALGVQRLPQIAVSDRVRAPIAVGVFRPVIILPAGSLTAISRDQLRDVLVHEIAHVRGRDNLVLFLQAIAKAVFWPILPIHLLKSALARAREDVRDNSVLASRDAVSYGETLLRLAELSRHVSSVAFSSGILNWRGRLEDRIARLIDHRRNTMTRTNHFIVALILGALLVPATLACGTTLVSAQTKPDQRSAKTKSLKELLGAVAEYERAYMPYHVTTLPQVRLRTAHRCQTPETTE